MIAQSVSTPGVMLSIPAGRSDCPVSCLLRDGGTVRSLLEPFRLDLPGGMNIDHSQVVCPNVHEFVRCTGRDDEDVVAGYVRWSGRRP